MRRRRAIIYDDEPVVLLVLKDFFETKGYEVLAFREPVVCPVYGVGTVCAHKAPCGDIMLTDRKMPGMTGIELLQEQIRRGCLLNPRNKALLSGHLDDEMANQIRDLGAVFFQKPVEFDRLDRWVQECEQRMDLARPMAIVRKEARQDYSGEVSFQVAPRPEVLRGTTVNLSSSGLCLKTPVSLAKEQMVTIQSALPLASPITLVRWVMTAGDGVFVAGLQCVAA